MGIVRSLTIALLAASSLAFACAEVPLASSAASQFDGPGETNAATSAQGVTVRTRFVLAGLDRLDEDMALDQLSVNVGAIFLDPADDSSMAFSNSDPFELGFSVGDGVTDIYGPELRLPYAGDFFVSVQVEPGGTLQNDGKDGAAAHSILARGHYYERNAVELVADEPSPLPWEPKRMQNSRSLTQHVDFTYRSDTVARIQLGQINLREKGVYELVLTVNVDGWMRENVLPVVRETAAEASRDVDVSQRLTGDRGVDLDGVLDDGTGTHGLVGDIGVGTRRF